MQSFEQNSHHLNQIGSACLQETITSVLLTDELLSENEGVKEVTEYSPRDSGPLSCMPHPFVSCPVGNGLGGLRGTKGHRLGKVN